MRGFSRSSVGIAALAIAAACSRSGLDDLESSEPPGSEPDAGVPPLDASDGPSVSPTDGGSTPTDAPSDADGSTLPPPPAARWLSFRIDLTAYAVRIDADGADPVIELGPSNEPPQWSPDGRFLALPQPGQILLLSFDQGAPKASLSVSGAAAVFTWSPLEPIAISTDPVGEEWTVIDARQEPALVQHFDLQPANVSLTLPVWAPDGRRVLVTRGYNSGFNQTFSTYVLDAGSTGPNLEKLTGPASIGEACIWSHDGRWIVCDSEKIQTGLMERAYFVFDTEAPSLPGVEILGSNHSAMFSTEYIAFGQNGWLIHNVPPNNELRAIHVPSVLGQPSLLLLDADTPAHRWSVSPDGRWLAYCGSCSASGQPALCLRELTPGSPHAPVVLDPKQCSVPEWAPDSKHLLYREGPDLASSVAMWLIEVDAPAPKPIEIPIMASGIAVPRWSPDSVWLGYDKSSTASLLFHVPSATHLAPFESVATHAHSVEWASDARVYAAAFNEKAPGSVRARFVQDGVLGKEIVVQPMTVGHSLAWQPLP